MNMHMRLVRIRHFKAVGKKGPRVKLTLVSGYKKSATFGYDYEAERNGIADYDILAFTGVTSGTVNRFVPDKDGDMFAGVVGN